ncbi:hypothetical protein ABVK25_004114 [Lepraria finkii]|uniref:Uncharacterized protein n=1 Tax=Lepraria finkii TaxID=1340010 RepID=A0ABR4BDQ7_9LECA
MVSHEILEVGNYISRLANKANGPAIKTQQSTFIRTVDPSKLAAVDDAAAPILVLSSGTVLLPMTKLPTLSKTTDVPLTVMPGPPALIAVSVIPHSDGFAVKVCPATPNAVVVGTSCVVAEAFGA